MSAISKPISSSVFSSLLVFTMILFLTGTSAGHVSASAFSDKLIGPDSAWSEILSRDDLGKPIIVEFKVPESPETASEHGDNNPDRMRADLIRSRQDDILDALFKREAVEGPANEERYPVKRLINFPIFAMVATAAQIRKLTQDARVLRIHEDLPHAPKLNQGTSIIGMPLAYTMGAAGENYNVAVLDTGVSRTHDFLRNKVVAAACFTSNRLVARPGGGVGEYRARCPGDVTQLIRIDAADDCAYNAISGCGHGTMVAGTAAGFNTGTAMPGIASGVARASKIISVNVASYAIKLPGDPTGLPVDSDWLDCSGLNCLRALSSDVARGLDHVYGLRNTFKIAAISVSFGRGQYTAACDQSPLKTIIDGLRAANIATVVPAGDDGYDNAVSSPGCISSAITVAGSAGLSSRLEASNWGSLVDLVAPASGHNFPVPANNSNAHYRPGNGTSIAAAFTAGAFAAVRSIQPNASVSAILLALQQSGHPINSAGIIRARLNVPEAVTAMNGIRILAAITPVARRGTVGDDITAFATVINPSDSTGTATGCTIARPADGYPYGFAFAERLLPGSSLGQTNAPFSLAPGQTRHFLMGFFPAGPVSSNLRMVFDCTNTLPAQSAFGLNTFNLVATTTRGADIIATAVTPTNDGILRIPAVAGGGNVAAMAGMNIGSSATLQALVSSVAVGASTAPLPIALFLCPTNPSTGQCLQPPSASPFTFHAMPNQVFTFTAFANYQGVAIPLDPANSRLYIHFKEGNTDVGSASVAVTAEKNTANESTFYMK